jgi:hypothetical protein
MVSRSRRLLALAVVFVLPLAAPAAARADAVLDWNKIAIETAIANGANPFQQARFAAIVQLAVFEAVNAVTREYEPYLGTIVAPAGASAEAAAVGAAHRVLSTYFPASVAGPTGLDAAKASSLDAIADAGEAEGLATGVAAADDMIARRANDGSSPLTFHVPGPPDPADPDLWQATPACPVNPLTGQRRGVFFNWQNVTPFGIPAAADFMPGPPPAVSSNQYLKDYNEVMDVGGVASTERPGDRANVARYYAATSPAYLLNLAARQAAAASGDSLTENARALALINMASSDALVTSFITKYHYLLWRPETAIRAGGANDKAVAVPGFAPFITTPCFPSYPSNHASGTSSGTEMLRRLYGEGGHSIVLTNPSVPGITLTYNTFHEISNDVDDARVYGGIHFRFDQDAGNRLGREVATYVYKNNLRKVN